MLVWPHNARRYKRRIETASLQPTSSCVILGQKHVKSKRHWIIPLCRKYYILNLERHIYHVQFHLTSVWGWSLSSWVKQFSCNTETHALKKVLGQKKAINRHYFEKYSSRCHQSFFIYILQIGDASTPNMSFNIKCLRHVHRNLQNIFSVWNVREHVMSTRTLVLEMERNEKKAKSTKNGWMVLRNKTPWWWNG